MVEAAALTIEHAAGHSDRAGVGLDDEPVAGGCAAAVDGGDGAGGAVAHPVVGPVVGVDAPVAVAGEVEVRKRVPLSLSFDHRLIDGVTANRFMEHVIEGIEDPDILLSRL